MRLRFDDGLEGVVDLEPELWGEVFEPLRDRHASASSASIPELATLVWPNGADLAPERLYERATASR